jgi:DNA mismatch endonuclease Vsr
MSPEGYKTSEARSRIMSAIRSKSNKTTEVALARVLRNAGLTGWRRHLSLPGTPDFAFPKERIAIFVDGCFWHGCSRCYRAPKSNPEFWASKVAGNRARDARVARKLRRAGWSVCRIWEHSLIKSPDVAARKIARMLGR